MTENELEPNRNEIRVYGRGRKKDELDKVQKEGERQGGLLFGLSVQSVLV